MSKNYVNPCKVITGVNTQLVLRQRLGAEVHQRWYAEVQRIPHHPKVGYEDR
jgi:hypothetical protein